MTFWLSGRIHVLQGGGLSPGRFIQRAMSFDIWTWGPSPWKFIQPKGIGGGFAFTWGGQMNFPAVVRTNKRLNFLSNQLPGGAFFFFFWSAAWWAHSSLINCNSIKAWKFPHPPSHWACYLPYINTIRLVPEYAFFLLERSDLCMQSDKNLNLTMVCLKLLQSKCVTKFQTSQHPISSKNTSPSD